MLCANSYSLQTFLHAFFDFSKRPNIVFSYYGSMIVETIFSKTTIKKMRENDDDSVPLCVRFA